MPGFSQHVKDSARFNPAKAASKLAREARSAALATLLPDTGDPYCSLVNIASAADGSPVRLISRLALHTKNIAADPRCSLMVDERKPGDPLEGARLTLQARAVATNDEHVRRRYLARQPGAEVFASFGDFGFYRLEVASAHLVAGFGRIVGFGAGEILTAVEDAHALLQAEPEIVAHMNEDHADTCRLYATALLGAPDGEWRCVGCDPAGLELQLERTALRLEFPERVTTPHALRTMLKALADRARGDKR